MLVITRRMLLINRIIPLISEDVAWSPPSSRIQKRHGCFENLYGMGSYKQQSGIPMAVITLIILGAFCSSNAELGLRALGETALVGRLLTGMGGGLQRGDNERGVRGVTFPTPATH